MPNDEESDMQNRTIPHRPVSRQLIPPAALPVVEVDEAQMIGLLDLFGVNDMAGIDGADKRVVMLSAASTLVCPAHERRLLPDACRSCRFLAGEVRTEG
jgi:hypothetical protein